MGYKGIIGGTLFVWASLCSAITLAQRVEFPERPKSPEKTLSTNPTPLKADKVKTIIELEVIVPANGVSSLVAQQWGKKLEDAGITPLFRTPRAGDGQVMDEKRIGQSRFVKMHATLEPSGKLTFPNQKSFTLSNHEKFVEWVHEIEAYGVQGKPDGQPVWGLTQAQFEAVFAKLSLPLETDTQGKTFTEALKPWENLHQFPLAISAQAREDLLSRELLLPVRQNVKGLSLGTALAIMLNEYDLCFYPERTAAGNFQIRVERQKDLQRGWPIGYDLESRDLLRQKVAPALFKVAMVQYANKPLNEMINEVEMLVGVKIFVDDTGLNEKSISLDKVLVNIPYKHNSPSLTLKSACFQGKLTQQLLVDEVNKPFIWITPFNPQISNPKTNEK